VAIRFAIGSRRGTGTVGEDAAGGGDIGAMAQNVVPRSQKPGTTYVAHAAAY